MCYLLMSFLFVGMLLSSGCVTAIENGGKDMSRVFVSTNSQAQIRQALGKPTAEITYPEPLAASTIPELGFRIRFEKLPPETLIQGYDDFAYRGRLYAPDGEGLAYMNTFTPMIGEVIFFPFVALGAIGESSEIHRYRVWYRTDGTFFAQMPLAPPKQAPRKIYSSPRTIQ